MKFTQSQFTLLGPSPTAFFFNNNGPCIVYQSWFIPVIQEFLATLKPPLKKSPIMSELSKKVMIQNSKVLKKIEYDLEKLIDYHPNSDHSYGTEFRYPYFLHKLMEEIRVTP